MIGIINIHGQVGINTTSPQATLQAIGKPDDTATKDGVIPPRITGTQLRLKNNAYGTDQDGTIIYVTEADPQAATKTIYVTSPGYYYYDAPNSVWVKMAKDHEVAHDDFVEGNVPAGGVNVMDWDMAYYTGGNISLIPGKWAIEYGFYMTMGQVNNGSWAPYPGDQVITTDSSVWCSCALSTTENFFTSVDSSTGLSSGSGRGGAATITRGEQSKVGTGLVLLNMDQPRTYYLFVRCHNSGVSLGTDRVGNFFGPAWERWLFATPF